MKPLHGAQLPPELGSLAWVHYMRWARRSDGLAASRKLFIRSRKWPQCGWQVRAYRPALSVPQTNCLKRSHVPRNTACGACLFSTLCSHMPLFAEARAAAA